VRGLVAQTCGVPLAFSEGQHPAVVVGAGVVVRHPEVDLDLSVGLDGSLANHDFRDHATWVGQQEYVTDTGDEVGKRIGHGENLLARVNSPGMWHAKQEILTPVIGDVNDDKKIHRVFSVGGKSSG